MFLIAEVENHFLLSIIVTIDFNKINVKGSLSKLDKFIKMGWYRADSE